MNFGDNLSPNGSVCLWLSSRDHRQAVFHRFGAKSWLDYACMQCEHLAIAYEIHPLVKFASPLHIVLTFEESTRVRQQVYWQYTIETGPESVIYVNVDLAKQVWKRLVADASWQSNELTNKYSLSQSQSHVRIRHLKNWKLRQPESLSKSNFEFVDPSKLGVLLKEENFIFSCLSHTCSIFSLFNNKD